MVKSLKILFLIYYSFGALCLPMSNFSVLPDLPEMYHHCKVYEDPDMNFFDFITDHVLNIDGIFDKHGNGDEQKPHSPIQNKHNVQVYLYQNTCPYSIKTTVSCFFETRKTIFETHNLTISNYISEVFRPPIVV